MRFTISIAILLFLLSSCEKELSLEGYEGSIPKPVDTVIKYQLTAFYSDVPIDFDDKDDVVKAETDLWPYVYDYIKDDYYILHGDSTVEILQNDIQKPGLADSVLIRNYSTGIDNNGRFIYYLTADYTTTKYRLYEMDEDHFVIGLKFKGGARVYSRFERVY